MGEWDFSADLPGYYRELLTDDARTKLDAKDKQRKQKKAAMTKGPFIV
jgi:hypothetical protein